MAIKWWGAHDRDKYAQADIERYDKLADAARGGQWERLTTLIRQPHPVGAKGPDDYVNATRLGGLSGYAPLHQVARQGAPAEVAQRLIDQGAWRTLRCSRGQTPVEIAEARGHAHLVPVLTPQRTHPVPETVLLQLEHVLHAVILGRIHDYGLDRFLRLPQLGPLTEAREPQMSFTVPGMYGGFAISLVHDGERAELDVESWWRVVGGSGQRHRVRADGFELTESGFV
ncbi:ankyrin repeat domain-containing protein [Nocardia huaxiensis]|uniref:Ankyrin repeat domain-containing protein n=1 Tax=Nocardia huaxiensis TaxID=2755382 RepID=A0A7D6Z123_9NOCA|nr:ankyrin repeat domain-containing protein [Nocardia huaxiensis]QLY29846.1 ankyrin repeat domain-containing protein [Nocardia huaxiensis]